MTRIVYFLITLCGPPLLLWLATGFVLWEWNPGSWSEAARFYAVLFSVVVMCPFVGLCLENT